MHDLGFQFVNGQLRKPGIVKEFTSHLQNLWCRINSECLVTFLA